MFNQPLLFNSNLQYQSTKNHHPLPQQTPQSKTTPKLTLSNLKSHPKPSLTNPQLKQNPHQLTPIQLSTKTIFLDKYFTRHDIVKDRLQKKLQNNTLSKNNTCRFQPKNKFKNLNQNTNYQKIDVEGNQSLQEVRIKHNKSVQNIKSGQKYGLKIGKTVTQKSLQDQMKEWALLKKKNEFEVFKLMKKNNYDRMRSNMIIAEAMTELMDERQRLLGGQILKQVEICSKQNIVLNGALKKD